jgi:hypothetical protein
MPFKSEKQRRWMHANEPEMAKRWEDEEKAKNRTDDRRSEKQKRKEKKD